MITTNNPAFENNAQNEDFNEEQLQQQINKLELALKQIMTRDAIQRYGNLKLAFPERALQALLVISQLVNSGKITQVDDSALKNVLYRVNQLNHATNGVNKSESIQSQMSSW